MNLTALRALLPVAALAGLAACTTPSPTPAAQPSTTPPASAAPASPAMPPTAVSPSPTRSTSSGTTPAACPVSAATLQAASGLPNTHRIDPDQISCARRWATAGVLAVDPGMQGDGVLLFTHSDGRWQKLAEGSALECTPFGIPPEIGDQVGCRDH
ncbi:hypothetical protein NIE79_002175 [Micromonospora sp. NIE79]|uniref:Uncharacterized protein n=1 Tax=Micromonospora trifolii TaxID=2911208 RepID=A0ABS9N246_9ACTN|nr:hypothetical protein [Micromonospora trifolii]MCG5444031.1 hypothetical protein [Micromonospora trifolii]